MAHAHAQSYLGGGGGLKMTCDARACYSFRQCARAALARTNKKRSLRNGKLKASRVSATEGRGTKVRG